METRKKRKGLVLTVDDGTNDLDGLLATNSLSIGQCLFRAEHHLTWWILPSPTLWVLASLARGVRGKAGRIARRAVIDGRAALARDETPLSGEGTVSWGIQFVCRATGSMIDGSPLEHLGR